MKFWKKNCLFCLIFGLFSLSLFADQSDEKTVQEAAYIEHIEASKIELAEKSTDSVVVISASVSKADVYINNVFQGRTKLLISDLLPGEYVVEVVKGGKKSSKWIITVKRGYKISYFIELN